MRPIGKRRALQPIDMVLKSKLNSVIFSVKFNQRKRRIFSIKRKCLRLVVAMPVLLYVLFWLVTDNVPKYLLIARKEICNTSYDWCM